jgi:hypothetical protein
MLPASDLTEIIANLSTRHRQSHSATEMTQPHPLLAQVQEPSGTGGEARGGRLVSMT